MLSCASLWIINGALELAFFFFFYEWAATVCRWFRGGKTIWQWAWGLHSSLLGCSHFTDAKESGHILFTLALSLTMVLLRAQDHPAPNSVEYLFTGQLLSYVSVGSVLSLFMYGIKCTFTLTLHFLSRFSKVWSNLVNHWLWYGLVALCILILASVFAASI